MTSSREGENAFPVYLIRVLPDIESYKKDPCGTLSIPYYKAKEIEIPEGVAVVHERDYDPAAYEGYSDEPYFRLIHRLKPAAAPESGAFSVRTAGEDDIPLIADMICRSYRDIGVSEDQLKTMRASSVFDGELWVIAYDNVKGLPAACGIAELDRETGEASLEWIQTLPESRRMGAGRLVVLTLLSRLIGKAGFVTVSGRANDPLEPKMLYRNCGFEGEDVWHVLRRSR